MKDPKRYIQLAYTSIGITTIYILLVLLLNKYGGTVENGTGAVSFIPFLMGLMGLAGLYCSSLYIYRKFNRGVSIKKELVAVLLVAPVFFLSCVQLYAAFLFMAWL